MTVAALYVETGGVYYGLPDVDPWNEERNALNYRGPHPVVAHPPCTRWSIMGQCRGYTPTDEDDMTFSHALACVREYGGVLEHPAHSKAWREFGLPRPAPIGWTRGLFDGGWACRIDQAHYGHRANKWTWLYVAGIDPPNWLAWGAAPRTGRSVRDDGGGGRDQRSRTPLAFRDVLLNMARSASPALHRLDGCA